MDGLTAAASLSYYHGRVGSPSGLNESELGQMDFKKEFLDKDAGRNYVATSFNMVPDQVHHTAAYLSMGINGQGLASYFHSQGDRRERNFGDVALGDAAYNLGSNIIETVLQI